MQCCHLVACMAALSGVGLSLQADVPADLSLGVKASDHSDLRLLPGGEINADVLAHYSTALQFEASGKLRPDL